MKIKGLDYNTQREQLVLPEYGREVQSMVDYCMDLKDRQERQRCAESIVAIMERMKPRVGDAKEYRHKLWDHLALMSGFRLDIDYPFDISQAQLKTLPEGAERNELIRLAANQMKRDLMQWGHGSSDNEKVASDIANYTHGTVELDLSTFKFDRTEMPQPRNNEKKQRRRKN